MSEPLEHHLELCAVRINASSAHAPNQIGQVKVHEREGGAAQRKVHESLVVVCTTIAAEHAHAVGPECGARGTHPPSLRGNDAE